MTLQTLAATDYHRTFNSPPDSLKLVRESTGMGAFANISGAIGSQSQSTSVLDDVDLRTPDVYIYSSAGTLIATMHAAHQLSVAGAIGLLLVSDLGSMISHGTTTLDLIDDVQQLATVIGGEVRSDVEVPPTTRPVADHAAAAEGLRLFTGLSASDLADILGVTRESYQRWIAGGAIKPQNEEQLHFAYALVKEAVRKMGREKLRAWLRTPYDIKSSGLTPLELMRTGRFDEVHRLIIFLPDAAPVADGRVVALTRMSDDRI